MSASMTPSRMITAGQIGKIQELLGAGLRKANFLSSSIQQIIETQGNTLVTDLIAAVRMRMESISGMISRHVKVDRTSTPQQFLDSTTIRQYTDHQVVDSMPKGSGDEIDVYFFKIGRCIDDDDLEKEYELRHLTPVDPYTLIAVNGDDLGFSNKYPNSTCWKDDDNRLCCAVFDSSWGEERVYCEAHIKYISSNPDCCDLSDDLWYAGILK